MTSRLIYGILATLIAGSLTTSVSAQTFGGYPCTIDCSGHEAGAQWAQQHGVTSAAGCGGNSQSFVEGCKAYTEENDDQDDYGSSVFSDDSDDESEDDSVW